MRETMLILLGVVSTGALTCLAAFTLQACWADKSAWLYKVLHNPYPNLILVRAYLILAAIGFLVCVYQGTHSMLWWFPASWGGHDEDGVWLSLRSHVSAASTLFMGFGLVGLISGGIRDRWAAASLSCELDTARLRVEDITDLASGLSHGCNTQHLQALLARLQTKHVELQKTSTRFPRDYDPRKIIEFDKIRELIRTNEVLVTLLQNRLNSGPSC